MNNSFKIFGVRGSLIGDMIMALPILNWLEEKYPGSYKYWAIENKCKQAAELFKAHPLINEVVVLKEENSFTKDERALIESCDIAFNIRPQHPDGLPGRKPMNDWWNRFSCIEETFRMAGLPLSEFQKLSYRKKFPTLPLPGSIGNLGPKAIGIFPFAAYFKEPKRSPSQKWWEQMVSMLIESGFEVHHFGWDSEPMLSNQAGKDSYTKFTNLPFFEQVKMALACKTVIGTDSGSSWVMGAYGHPQINLLTNHAPGHVINLHAFAPQNWTGRVKNLFAFDGCDNISKDSVIKAIEEL